MKNNKNGLDEMQKEKRNSIGNQMFLLMSYAFFLDMGLYNAGLRWLNYPANIMVIITVCMVIYLVRTIAANAYLPPKAQNRKRVVSVILANVFSIVLAIAMINLFGNSPSQAVETTQDNSALILVIVSVVGLLALLITVVTRKLNFRKEKFEE